MGFACFNFDMTRREMRKLVVGIPCHNESKYISNCLHSIRQNDLSNIQVEIYDNASTDDTVSKVEYFIESLPEREKSSFVLKTRSSKVNVTESFLSTFYESDSEYFLWVGGHDLLSNNYLNKCVNILENDPDVSMASGRTFGFTSSIENARDLNVVYDFSDTNRLARYIKSIQTLNNCTIFHSVFRRQDLKKVNFSNNCPSLDHIIISNLLWFGKLEYVNDVGYLRRYFDDEDRKSKRSAGQYVTAYNTMTFLKEYLENFRQLSLNYYPSILQGHTEKIIFDALVNRFGLPY